MKHLQVPWRLCRQRGVTLLEILITMFILAVGILGTAGLQLKAKRANFEARQRTTASALAQDILERMRANAAALATYTADGVGTVLTGADAASQPCPSGSSCTTTQLAQFDLYEWEQALVGASEQRGAANIGGLLAVTGCIDGPVAGGSGDYSIAIAWRGQEPLSNPSVSTCGQGSGLYDATDGSQPDVHRRILVLNVYITEPS